MGGRLLYGQPSLGSVTKLVVFAPHYESENACGKDPCGKVIMLHAFLTPPLCLL